MTAARAPDPRLGHPSPAAPRGPAIAGVPWHPEGVSRDAGAPRWPPRCTAAVIADHVACVQAGDLERNLEDNYDEDVLVVSQGAVDRGVAAIRSLAESRRLYLPTGSYELVRCVTDEDTAYVKWRSSLPGLADAWLEVFVVEEGRIVAYSISS